MADYITSAVASFEQKHHVLPTQVILGLSAALVLAKAKELYPECCGVPVIARPLLDGEHPAMPGEGTKIYITYDSPTRSLRVAELA